MIAPTPPAIEVFFCYAHEDESLRDKLAKHLKLLERQGVIQGWHDRQILPGTEWQGQLDHHLETAQLILLLISADFLASDYCYDIEMKRALERHEAKDARVIPIILRPVDNWDKSPFGKLQALPKGGKPITRWQDKDEAFANVVQGIRRAVEAWQQGDRGTFLQSGGNAESEAEQPASQLAQPPQPQGSSMHQTNTGSSTGWQFNVSGGTVNITPPGQSSKPDEPAQVPPKPSSGTLTPMQRQRLEQRRDRLQQEWQLRSSKLDQLRSAHAIEASAAVKFQLEQQIKSEESHLNQLEAELNQVEQDLSAGVGSTPPR